MASPNARDLQKVSRTRQDVSDRGSVSQLNSYEDGGTWMTTVSGHQSIVSPLSPRQSEIVYEIGGDSQTPSLSFSEANAEGSRKTLAESQLIRRNLEIDNGSEENIAKEKWYPFWLRRPILGAFSFLFLCLAILIPLLLFMLVRKKVNSSDNEEDTLVWRFGPTAFVTLITALWSRVEYQAQRYMPWIAIKTGTTAETRALELDYTQVLPHRVLLKALRRKHWLVVLVVCVGHFLKVQTILSSALFQLKNKHVTNSIEVQVLDSFNETGNIKEVGNRRVYHDALAIQELSKPYPFGVAKEAAYQTFTRGTREEITTVQVDGLFMDMKCLQLESYTQTKRITKASEMAAVETNLKFKGCLQELTVSHEFSLAGDGVMTRMKGTWTTSGSLANPRPCPSLPQKHPQLLQAGILYDVGKDLAPELASIASVLCAAEAWVSKVEVVDDGSSPYMIVHPGESKRLIESNPWYLLENSTSGIDNSLITLSEGLGTLRAGLGSAGASLNLTDPSLYNSERLEQSLMNVTRLLGPMIAHSYLREETQTQVFGSMERVSPRLELNMAICWAMTALFLVSSLMSGMSILYSRSQRVKSIWNRDPATLLGQMLFLHSSSTMYMSIAGSLRENRDTFKSQWSHSHSTPAVLKSWARALYTVLILILIIVLVALLQTSMKHDGLATLREEYWAGAAWRLVPSAIMLSATLYIRSCDSAIRDLATLSILSIRPCLINQLDVSLSDRLGVRALFDSLWLGVPAVTLSQLLAIICGFLSSIAATLYSSRTISGVSKVELQQTSWFGSGKYSTDDGNYNQAIEAASTVLTQKDANFTYPQNTYTDLIFPSLDVGNLLGNEGESINLTIPAATLRSSCSQAPSQDRFIQSHDEDSGGEIFLGVHQRLTCPNGTEVNYKNMALVSVPYSNEDQQFGDIFNEAVERERYCDFERAETPDYQPWNLQTYIWGNIRYNDGVKEPTNFEVWVCNYTWVAIDTDLTLIREGNSTVIDHKNPPAPDESTIKPWEPPFSIPYTESEMNLDGEPFYAFKSFSREPEDQIGAYVVREYSLIIEPFGPLKKDCLGKKEDSSLILDALHSNLAIISAQIANVVQRLDLDEESAVTPTTHPDLARITGQLTDNNRKRLVQSPTITYVLVAILSLTVLVNSWALLSTLLPRSHDRKWQSWLLDIDLRGLAPDRFNSISMMEALLRGSNYFDMRPDLAHLKSTKELAMSLGERRFRMGWFVKEENGEESFTIGVLDDPDFKFLRDKR